MIANRYFIMSHTDIHLHAHLNMLTDVPSLRNSNILKAKFRDRLLQRRLTLYTLLKNKQIISKFIANYFQTGLISVRSYKSHCCSNLYPYIMRTMEKQVLLRTGVYKDESRSPNTYIEDFC